MKLNEDEILKLLELYNEYDYLWNLGTMHYRNRAKRQAAEEEIVQRFAKVGFGVSELKQKIKNLRCTYNQECIKIQKSKKSGSGSSNVYEPSVKWFTVMDNLVKTSKGNKKSEEYVESIIQNPQIAEESEDTHSESILATKQTRTPPMKFCPQNAQNARELLPTKRSATQKERVSNKKKKIEHLADAVRDLRRVTDCVYDHGNSSTDEHDAFGIFVAASLKKLPTAEALQAQHEIQGVLMKHRLQNISQEKTGMTTSSASSSEKNLSRPSNDTDMFFFDEEDNHEEVILEFDQNTSIVDVENDEYDEDATCLGFD